MIGEVAAERAEIVANSHWRGPRGNLGSISVRLVDPYELLAEWDQGGLDFLLIPAQFSDELERVEGGDIVALPLPSTEYVGFPPRAPFDDERVRKALAHGLDRAPLVAGSGNLPGYGGLLPPAMPGHSHDLAPDYDLDRARGLLAEAGYPGGDGLPELRLLHPDWGLGARLRGQIEARWAGQWTELGVRVKQEWATFDRIYVETDVEHSFWEWGWASDYPDPRGFLGALLGQRTAPIPHDAELSRLLERAQSSHSRDEQLTLYRQVDRRLVAEQTWLVPTVYDTWYILRRPWVEGLWGTPLGMGTLGDVVVGPRG